MMIDNPGIDSTIKLCIQAQGTDGSTKFFDRSQSRRSITTYNNVILSSSSYEFGNPGQSIYFDGNVNYLLTLTSASELSIASQDAFFGAWINFTRDAPAVSTIAGYGGGSYSWEGGTGHEWMFSIEFGQKSLYFHYSNGSGRSVLYGTIPSTTGWHYVSFSKVGSLMSIYCDGLRVANGSVSIGTSSSPYRMVIGDNSSTTGPCPYKGYMDDIVLRIGESQDGTIVPVRRTGT